MNVCDMCLKDLTDKGKDYVKIQGDSILDVDENYVLCKKCSRKLKRYIKFERSKNNIKVGVEK